MTCATPTRVTTGARVTPTKMADPSASVSRDSPVRDKHSNQEMSLKETHRGKNSKYSKKSLN